MINCNDKVHGITPQQSNKTTYTVEEISALLNISMKSAYSLIKTGQFHHVRAGRMIRVSKKSFDKWLNQ